MGNVHSQVQTFRPRRLWGYWIGLLFVFAVCAALWFTDSYLQRSLELRADEIQQAHANDILPNGIFVDQIPVGNMTTLQAQEILVESVQTRRNQMTVTVSGRTEQYLLRLSETMISHNVPQVLREALTLGTALDRMDYAKYIRSLPFHPVYLDLSVQVDPSLLEDEVRNLAVSLSSEPVDAGVLSFDPSREEDQRFTFQKEIPGYAVDADWLWNEVCREFLQRQDGEVEVIAKTLDPEIRLSDLQEANHAIGSYTVEINCNEAQAENLKKICQTLTGTVLRPGAVFSWNDAVGDCTQENGYRMDGSVDAMANVAATALMNAALLADFSVEQRSPNLQILNYVPRGQEVQVNKDEDFRLRNGGSSCAILALYVHEDGSAITAQVYAAKRDPSKTVEIFTQIEETIPVDDGVQYVASTRLTSGETFRTQGVDGALCSTYRVVKENGEEILREEIFRTEYPPTPARVYYCSEDEAPQIP